MENEDQSIRFHRLVEMKKQLDNKNQGFFKVDVAAFDTPEERRKWLLVFPELGEPYFDYLKKKVN